MSGRFTEDHISDQKRIVRGEQYLAARAFLRSRSTERSAPRVLMLAGGNPAEEIGVIRELWRGSWTANITAVDCIKENVDAAISAGADSGFVIDLADAHAHEILLADGRFDLMHLDFCGTAGIGVRDIVARYHAGALTMGGVNIVAFSYGHDVVETYVAAARGGHLNGGKGTGTQALIERGVPESVCGRIIFLANKRQMAVETIVLYRGNAVPMCSLLLTKRRARLQESCKPRNRGESAVMEDAEWPHNLDGDSSRISVANPSGVDIVDAIEQVSATALYALPEERLGKLKRQAAARKAVETRLRTNGAMR